MNRVGGGVVSLSCGGEVHWLCLCEGFGKTRLGKMAGLQRLEIMS